MASEYLKWKYRDVRPDAPVQLTPRQRAANWWQYHKWWLLVGIVVLAAGADILWHALGIGAIRPDCQAAFVAAAPVSDAALAALESALSEQGADFNGDGRALCRVNAYVDMSASSDGDAAQYAAAAKIRLMADLESRQSYFFICDSPETLHEQFDILARSDGAIAGPSDPVEYFRLEALPALKALVEAQPELSGLYLARRGFWEGRTGDNKDECDALWNRLTEGAAS